MAVTHLAIDLHVEFTVPWVYRRAYDGVVNYRPGVGTPVVEGEGDRVYIVLLVTRGVVGQRLIQQTCEGGVHISLRP